MANMPAVSNFPSSFDTDQNLFLVRDALRVRLLQDYNPGDSVVYVEGDAEVMARFPPTGIITLTEHCGDIDLRAISFYYNSKTDSTFEGLEILPGFKDVVKPKRITNVTMNVMDLHHNHLKDALIQIQSVLGERGDVGDTIAGRIKRVESVMFRPKAWFSSDKTIGLADSVFRVKFTNRSLRAGNGAVTQTWNFGDGETREITTQNKEEYEDSLEVNKTYSSPGLYTVSLKIENEFGSDEVIFENMINVRAECPEEAIIEINSMRGSHPDVCGSSSSSGQFIPPKIRATTNTFIRLAVPEGQRSPSCPYSYAGEQLGSSSSAVDPIEEWTWSLGDDLSHSNQRSTNASYSIGGYYDVVLRVDTRFGAYRITKYENSIDIIEATNLWLFNFSPSANSSSTSGCGGVAVAYEFGLNSETFKVLGNSNLCVTRSEGFLNSAPPYYHADTRSRAKHEFRRNVEFARSGTKGSGDRGESLLFWAGGGGSTDGRKIHVTSYNAFSDQYESIADITGRPWNWASLVGDDYVYFLFGQDVSPIPNENRAFDQRLDYNLLSKQPNAPEDLTSVNFENGAGELLDHPSFFVPPNGSSSYEGMATNGYFAVYRTAWKDSTGYILRNSGVNEFFRISSFYKTKGEVSNVYSAITKLPDVVGSPKLEAQMVALYNGVYVFNNTGEISAWNSTSLTWEVGRANSTSLSFRSLQDSTVSGFDNRANTLLATSDGDRAAYLSYDYSSKAFVKFNATDLTFTALRPRPAGEQFKMGVY